MLLIVDFSGLDMEASETEIRVSEENGLTAERFVSLVCAGIEELSYREIHNRSRVVMLDQNHRPVAPTQHISRLGLSDWDRVYLVRR